MSASTSSRASCRKVRERTFQITSWRQAPKRTCSPSNSPRWRGAFLIRDQKSSTFTPAAAHQTARQRDGSFASAGRRRLCPMRAVTHDRELPGIVRRLSFGVGEARALSVHRAAANSVSRSICSGPSATPFARHPRGTASEAVAGAVERKDMSGAVQKGSVIVARRVGYGVSRAVQRSGSNSSKRPPPPALARYIAASARLMHS